LIQVAEVLNHISMPLDGLISKPAKRLDR